MSPLSRRQFLRTGGLALGVATVAAACGNDTGDAAPGRIGFAPPPPTLPEVEDPASDVTLLRTMQSLEHSVLALYDALLGTGVLSGDETAVFEAIVANHTARADELAGHVADAGGESFACENQFFMARSVTPTLEALEGSDDVHRDVLNIAFSYESLLGASYQNLVRQLATPALRSALIMIGSEAQRHATVLARLVTPDQTFAPVFFNQPEEKSADGFVVPYAIPSVFGRVNPIELVVGAPNDEGTRFSTLLQTPAQNTFVYEYMSCDA